MPIVSARDNENNRWNRNAQKTKQSKTKKKKNKDRKEQGVRETIMKGWELNDFVAHLS